MVWKNIYDSMPLAWIAFEEFLIKHKSVKLPISIQEETGYLVSATGGTIVLTWQDWYNFFDSHDINVIVMPSKVHFRKWQFFIVFFEQSIIHQITPVIDSDGWEIRSLAVEAGFVEAFNVLQSIYQNQKTNKEYN